MSNIFLAKSENTHEHNRPKHRKCNIMIHVLCMWYVSECDMCLFFYCCFVVAVVVVSSVSFSVSEQFLIMYDYTRILPSRHTTKLITTAHVDARMARRTRQQPENHRNHDMYEYIVLAAVLRCGVHRFYVRVHDIAMRCECVCIDHVFAIMFRIVVDHIARETSQ